MSIQAVDEIEIRREARITINTLSYAPQLDGLRGLSILLVLALHGAPHIFPGGYIGVDIFFFISGYLITTLCKQEVDRFGDFSFAKFYARRAIRLLPALCAVVLCVLFIEFLRSPEAAIALLPDAGLSLLYLTNWSQALNWRPNHILGHTWSLSVEEQFYLVWPPILIGLLYFSKMHHPKQRQVELLVVAAPAIAALLLAVWRLHLQLTGSSTDRIYKGLDTHSDAILLGCSYALACSFGLINQDRQGITPHRMMAGLSIATLLGFLLATKLDSIFTQRWGYLLIALATAALVHSTLNANIPGLSFLSGRHVVWIGQLSYGLYLWHFPIFDLLRESGMRARLIVLIGLSASLIAAYLSSVLLERPLSRLLRPYAVRKGPSLGL